jgi:endoglucanase
VVEWVTRWVSRRDDLTLKTDSGGNLLITQKGRKSRPLVLAVAHMDHPAFVLTEVDGTRAAFEFRGGVNPEYFDDAAVELVSGVERIKGTVTRYDPESRTGVIEMRREGASIGDIAMWDLSPSEPESDRFFAPACDDLAGCAAAMAALDKARKKPTYRHFGVLLTRAEEVGLVGANHAARSGTFPEDARLLSIETSPTLPNAPIGEGPIIRVGDASTIFDQELSNRIAHAARRAGISHQRKLMDGGGCEATVFGAYGYRSTGLCLALGNHHNRGNLAGFEAGTADPVPMEEEISIADFHGLVDLLLLAANAVDDETDLRERLDALYEETGHVLRDGRPV